MTCRTCVGTITAALSSLPGILSCDIRIGSGVIIHDDTWNDKKLIEEIDAVGFEAKVQDNINGVNVIQLEVT